MLISLRDLSGGIASDSIHDADKPVWSRQHRDYVRGGGHLLAMHTVCGPPPTLSLTAATSSFRANFLLDLPVGQTAVGDFTVHVEGMTSGATSTFTFPSTTTGFYLLHALPNADEDNRIRVKAEYACGDSGYGNAVYYRPQSTGGPTCLVAMGVSHADFSTLNGGRTTVELQANDAACAPGTEFDLLYLPEGGTTQLLLASDIKAGARYELPDTPKGAGLGTYYFAELDPVTQQPIGDGPQSVNRADGTEDGSGEFLPEGAWRTEFYQWDHLGSTRLVTDEAGLVVSGSKYYPFGMYAELSADVDATRARFTGHERDHALGLDYMLARYYGADLGRFLSTDPGDDTYLVAPQSWNKYSYVRNNPINASDPTGTIAETPFDVAMAVVSVGQAINEPSFANIAGAVLDVAAVVIPGAPAVGGRAIDAAQAGNKLIDAGKAGGNIAENAAKGAAHEAKVVENLQQTQTGVVTQVTVKTESGVKTRLDAVGTDPATGATKLTEAKSSATAPLTKNQAAARPEMAQSGATVVGQGKPGVPGGTKIPPTKVDVIRPEK